MLLTPLLTYATPLVILCSRYSAYAPSFLERRDVTGLQSAAENSSQQFRGYPSPLAPYRLMFQNTKNAMHIATYIAHGQVSRSRIRKEKTAPPLLASVQKPPRRPQVLAIRAVRLRLRSRNGPIGNGGTGLNKSRHGTPSASDPIATHYQLCVDGAVKLGGK